MKLKQQHGKANSGTARCPFTAEEMRKRDAEPRPRKDCFLCGTPIALPYRTYCATCLEKEAR